MIFSSLIAVMLAFNSTLWFDKREVMTREAERLHVAFTNCASKITAPAEGVNIPLETFDNGSVKLLISAKQAQIFLDAGYVWAKDVTICKFNDELEEVSRIESAECVIDRNTKCGWSEGTTEISLGKTVFSGSNMFFSSTDGYVISFEKSSVISTDMKFGGAL